MKKLLILLLLYGQCQAQATVKSGRWSNPSTWKGNKIPAPDAKVTINHTITFDTSVTISGLTISPGAVLSFDRVKTEILTSSANIINYGRLIMKPLSPLINHKIIFSGVDESKFIGGGMDVLDSDVGLWVRDAGTLELTGSPKTSWTRLTGSVAKGQLTLQLSKYPVGWKIGDEISIAPTISNYDTDFYKGFEIRTIKSIIGATVILDTDLSFDHPAITNPFKAGTFTAEVMNLTRNVKIEGTDTGRAHINIGMTSSKFNVSNVQIRYMGPRKNGEKVLGRYALHFHMLGDAPVGSIIDGIVIRDCGSHAFVPHASNGITFKNCISYNTFEDAYWWDTPPDNGTGSVNNSNGITFDNCIAAITKCDPPYRGYRLASFLLGSGLRNTVKNCVAVGNQGNAGAAGFHWPESSNYTDNVWTFDSNISHNNKTDGIFVWENDPHNHIVNNFTAYNNGNNGIEHGAYVNGYKYSNIQLIGNKNGLFLYSLPTPNGTPDQFGYIVTFKNIQSTDPLYITAHTLPGSGPTLFKDCHFPNVIINELPARVQNPPPGLFDFINCNLKQTDFDIIGMEKESFIRVQNGNTAFSIYDNGIIAIASLFFNN